MKDYQVAKHNLATVIPLIEDELEKTPFLLLTTQDPGIGKWGMTRLWRAWMSPTAKCMAGQGITMPLCIAADGTYYGSRPFNEQDAHELFTAKWLGVDGEGNRLSWAKKDHDGKRAANKGERYFALQRHECWASERGITLFKPRDSEYMAIEREEAA